MEKTREQLEQENAALAAEEARGRAALVRPATRTEKLRQLMELAHARYAGTFKRLAGREHDLYGDLVEGFEALAAGRGPPARPAGPPPLRSLVAYGAPLALHGAPEMPLEDAVVAGLAVLGPEPRVFLCLPIVLAYNVERLQPDALRRLAAEAGLEAELGMVLELTAEVSGDRRFAAMAVGLAPLAGPPRFLSPPPHTRLGRRNAERHAPAVARKWGFIFRTPLSSFYEFFAKHTGRGRRPMTREDLAAIDDAQSCEAFLLADLGAGQK